MSRRAVADRLFIGRRFTSHSFDYLAEELVLHITPWERAALQLLAEGIGTLAMAHRFGTTEHDLEERLTRLFTRMGVVGPGQAVAAAFRRGLLNNAPRGHAG